MAELRFEHGGTEVSIAAERTGRGWHLRLPDGAEYVVEANERSGTSLAFTAAKMGLDGALGQERILAVPVAQIGQGVAVSWKGRVYHFRHAGRDRTATPAQDASGAITAPTGGVVADLLVVEGQPVEAFEQIAVIEAMKVMTPIEAPRAGIVGRIFVTRGQRIEQGAKLVHIEQPPPAMPGEATKP